MIGVPRMFFCGTLEHFAFEEAKCEAAAQRRPAERERENRVFPAKRLAVWFGSVTRSKRKMLESAQGRMAARERSAWI